MYNFILNHETVYIFMLERQKYNQVGSLNQKERIYKSGKRLKTSFK